MFQCRTCAGADAIKSVITIHFAKVILKNYEIIQNELLNETITHCGEKNKLFEENREETNL